MWGNKLFAGMALIVLLSICPAAFGDTVTYTYDDFGRLTYMANVDTTYLTKINYLYDNVGNFTNQNTYVGILVNMPDANLKAAVYAALGKNTTDPLTRDDMALLTSLSAAGKGIADLTGLEWAVNLTTLDVRNNNITSLTPLSGLTKLTSLQDSGNPVAGGAAPVPAMGNIGLLMTAMILMLLIMGRRFRFPTRLIAFAALCFALSAAPVHADDNPAGPGWVDAQGIQITPEQADAFYQAKGAFQPQDTTSGTISPMGTTAPPVSATTATPEITALARALKNDPIQIYQYVRNNVDYVPYYGSLKGATLTYIDGAGNDFDQASLMIALLRASGYTAQYVNGPMTILASGDPNQMDLQHWLNVDTGVITTLLSNGGFPPPSQSGSSWVVNRVWVQLTITNSTGGYANGTYLFDPAFKPYQTKTGINLQNAMKYNKSTLLSVATAGSTAVSNYVQNLNEAGLKSTLDGYTMNLANFIKTNYPNAATSDIIGGRTIVPQTLTALPTSLSFPATAQNTWTDIPQAFVHTVQIQHGGINQTLNIHALAGQKLSLVYRAGTVTSYATQAQPVPADLQQNLAEPQTTAIDMNPITSSLNPPDPLPGISLPVPPLSGSVIQPMTVYNQPFGTIQNTNTCSNCWYITYSNPSGYPPLNVSSSLVNTSGGAFSISSGGGSQTVPAGGSLTIYVTYTGVGQNRGNVAATFNIDAWYTGGPHSPNTYNFTGTVAETAKLSGSGINFKVAYMNSPASTNQVSITNNGSQPLYLNAKTITPSAANFQFGSASDYNPTTIQPGATQQINITYLANTHGSQSASINFGYTYDGLTYPAQNQLSLSGTTYYQPNNSGTTFGFGSPDLGYPVDGTVTLTNNGVVNLSITGVSLTGNNTANFQITGGNQAGDIAPGQTRTVNVRYLANSVGSQTANVHITYNFDNLSYDGVSHNGLSPLPPVDLSVSGTTLSTPVAQLWLDDTEIAEEAEPVTGVDLNSMYISVRHQYSSNPSADQLNVKYNLKRGSTYAIIYDFGGSRLGRLVEKRERQLQNYRESGQADSSRQVLTESLNVIGATWMRDTTLNSNLLAQIQGVNNLFQHRFGVVAQETGYYIDVKVQLTSMTSIHGDTVAQNTFFKAINHLASAMEHGVLEQMQTNSPSVSTVKLLQLNNTNGNKLFLVNSSNFGTTTLLNYSPTDLTNFQNLVNQGHTLILPENGKITLLAWYGKGYIDYYPGSTYQSVGMIIGPGYNGGYGASLTQLAVNPEYAAANLNIAPPAITPNVPSTEPVDMATGYWMYDNTDLTLSGGTGGLSLMRSYNSGNNYIKGSLGYGWTHNYNIFVEPHSSSPFGLGQRQPVDGAALMVASVATLDFMNGTPDLNSWLIGALIGKWSMDKLTNNAASVHLKTDVLTYVKLPDGSFAAPPGVTSQLAMNGSTYQVTERFGHTVNFGTDNNVSSMTDADGNTVNFSYSNGLLQSVSTKFGQSLTFNYTNSLLTSVSDSAGRSITYGYTGNDLTSYTDPEGKVWYYGPDANHRIQTLKNPLGITTVTNVYDSFGRVQSQTLPRQSGTTTYNLYFSGYRNIEEDGYGNDTVYFFDEQKHLLGVQNALGQLNTKSYDGQGHVVSQTDPHGYTTTYTYDGNNNLTMVTDPYLKTTVNTYDGQYHLTDVTDPLNHFTHTDYDTKHHPIKTTVYPALGQSIYTQKSYYANGLVNTTTDGKGVVTTLTQDGYGNPKSSQTSTAPAIGYVYDAIGRISSLTDQVGSKTIFTYDKRSLLKTVTDPLNKITSLTYYDDGTLKTKTDRNGRTTTYTYTSSGKVATITYQGGAQVIYTYDNNDNLLKMQDSIGTTTYTYDAANRLASITDPHGFIVGYHRDPDGLISGIAYPGGKNLNYFRDRADRIDTIMGDWPHSIVTYNYDDASRLYYIEQFNYTTTQFSYDNANRLTSLGDLYNGGSPIASYSYTLDNNGNRTGITQTVPIGLSATASNTAFTMNTQKDRLSQAGATGFSYDNEGQLATKGSDIYTFDDAHRLISIAGSVNYQFKYDGAGNRLEATRNGVTTRYVYDGDGNLLAEADGNNVIQKYYLHGPGVLAMVTASDSKLYTYHFDGTGHTVAVTDLQENVVNKYAYTPFGAVANQQETITQPFKYVGEYGVMTEPNGLVYMRARYYDSSVGRFIEEDPIAFGGGNVNLMAYAGNNPVMQIDPNGQWLLGAGIGAVGGFFGGLTSGIINGNAKTGIIGGIVGGITGAIAGTVTGLGVGLVAPDIVGTPASMAAAASAGAIVGGAVGGAFNGLASSGKVTWKDVGLGAFSGAVAAPLAGAAALGGAGELGIGIAGASGGILGDTVGAAGLKIWNGASCGK
jgi:RHS repeat-associated protein